MRSTLTKIKQWMWADRDLSRVRLSQSLPAKSTWIFGSEPIDLRARLFEGFAEIYRNTISLPFQAPCLLIIQNVYIQFRANRKDGGFFWCTNPTLRCSGFSLCELTEGFSNIVLKSSQLLAVFLWRCQHSHQGCLAWGSPHDFMGTMKTMSLSPNAFKPEYSRAYSGCDFLSKQTTT